MAPRVTELQFEVLCAAYTLTLYWTRPDVFFTDHGNATRPAQTMRGAGFIREVPGSAVWFPAAAVTRPKRRIGNGDQPCRLYEITPKGHDVLVKESTVEHLASLDRRRALNTGAAS